MKAQRMFRLHPILSNHHYKLLKLTYRVCDDIQQAPNLELPSHLLASKWEEALNSHKAIAYGYEMGNGVIVQPVGPLYLILQCEQLSQDRFSAIVRVLSESLQENMLSEPFGIEFTYRSDLERLERCGKTYTPLFMLDVVKTFDVLDQ